VTIHDAELIAVAMGYGNNLRAFSVFEKVKG